MPPPPPAPPSLPDELVEEIFLRFPPDEPACLVRASLSSKLWLGVLSGPRFRGRYHEHHGAPPMLGFLRGWMAGYDPDGKGPVPRFTSTAKFGARIPDDEWDHCDYSAWDCRHGRVLLGDTHNAALLVWDPMTGRRRGLDWPNLVDDSHGVAVLCAVSGCHHRTCHAAPYQVVFVGVEMNPDEDDDCVAFACVSLPETGDWSKPCPRSDQWGKQCPDLHLPVDAFIQPMPPVLIQEALHFMIQSLKDDSEEILKYDLSSNSLSLIAAPIEDIYTVGSSILMAMEDGSLGYAHVNVNGSTLYLWSRLMDSNGVASWSQHTVINLRNLLPFQNPMETIRLVGSVEAGDVVFVTTELGIYEINVESQRWKKVWKRVNFDALIPYMSFYNRQERVTLTPSDAAR